MNNGVDIFRRTRAANASLSARKSSCCAQKSCRLPVLRAYVNGGGSERARGQERLRQGHVVETWTLDLTGPQVYISLIVNEIIIANGLPYYGVTS